MSSMPPLPPKYRKVAARVDDAVAQAAGAEPWIALQIVVEEDSSPAEIKAAQKAAIAEHLASHPEHRGRAVDWWLIRTIVAVKGTRPAEYQPPTALIERTPPAAAPKRSLVDDYDEPALD
jgi:hypothetical protein